MTSSLCVMILAASACGSSGDDDVADAPISVPSTHETTSGPGQLQYGDSLEALRGPGAGDSGPPLAAQAGFEWVEWDDLIPPGFSPDQIYAEYEEQLAAVEPGSAELDAIYDEMNAQYDEVSVNPQLDTAPIQLAGFVAPLTYDGARVTEFLLVPFFGACIHVPPPPSNQTVMVTLPEGESLSLEESWGAVWVAGEMLVTTTDTDLARAGYAIDADDFGVYETEYSGVLSIDG